MQITVEYAAQIKRSARIGSEKFEVPAGSNLCDLFAAITERHGDALKELLLDSRGTPRKSILVFVDEDHIVDTSSLPLKDQSTVTIMTPISGG